MPRRPGKLDPQIVEMPPQTVAVVRTVGDPNVVAQKVMPALYGAAYTLKFQLKKQGQDFKVGALRARWSGAPDSCKQEWVGLWALPIPEGTVELAQKDPEVPVKVEVWEYGTVAQILHLGPYSEETPTIARLHDFIAGSGHEIAGCHEEEYLTRPDAKAPKTVIRYVVRPVR